MGNGKQSNVRQLDVKTLALSRDDITGRVREGWRVVIPAVVGGEKVQVGGNYQWRPQGGSRQGFIIPLKIERLYGRDRRVALVGEIGYECRGETVH